MKVARYRTVDHLGRIVLRGFPGYTFRAVVTFFHEDYGLKIVPGDLPEGTECRRLDDLCRVVIPRQLRRRMRLPQAPQPKPIAKLDQIFAQIDGDMSFTSYDPDGLAGLFAADESQELREPNPVIVQIMFDLDSREIELRYKCIDLGTGVLLSVIDAVKHLDYLEAWETDGEADGLGAWYSLQISALHALVEGIC